MRTAVKSLAIFSVCLIAAAVCLHSMLFKLTDDIDILKITLTGKTEKRWVEWKNPGGQNKSAELTCYEVIISSIDDEPFFHTYIYGDLCAVRGKILRLHPWLNRLGFSNLYHIDAIYNGYRKAEDYNAFPVEATVLDPPSSLRFFFESFFWDKWKKTFSDYYTSKWIKSATLESNYFPLTQSTSEPYCGGFFLTITPGGLSSIPVKTK